jgi:hypothetical protein
MIVGWTASRMGLTPPQKDTLLSELHRLGATQLHHGDCQGGDADGHEIARSLGLWIVGHPPAAEGLRAHCACDETREPAPYLTRDHNIVLETQVLLAGPDGRERLRSGTWTTIRYAKRLHRPVGVIDTLGMVAWSDSVYA